MKKLVATAPRMAALVEYEDRPVAVHEVKIRALWCPEARYRSGGFPRGKPVYR